MAQKRNVMILFGGRSNEHDVSLMSVSSIIKNIDTAKYNLHLIGITREGIWKHYQGDAADLTHWQNSSEPIILPADPSYGGYFPYSRPQEIHKIDVAFPVMPWHLRRGRHYPKRFGIGGNSLCRLRRFGLRTGNGQSSCKTNLRAKPHSSM